MEPFRLCDKRKELIETSGHLLILGGPGSGKTTISLIKANEIVKKGTLLPGQKILFLSFARSTISRIEEHTKSLLDANSRSRIEISTYHGCIWQLLRNYGYLLVPHRKLQLLTPHSVGALLAEHENGDARRDVLKNLLYERGLLGFDLFAESAANLLQSSSRIRNILT